MYDLLPYPGGHLPGTFPDPAAAPPHGNAGHVEGKRHHRGNVARQRRRRIRGIMRDRIQHFASAPERGLR